MAEDNKPSSTQAKASTGTSVSKTTTAAKPNSTTKTATKQEGEEQSLALSTPAKIQLPENRPIEPSHLEIVHTYSSVGSDRPVSKGTVKFTSSLAISGDRPIAASTLQVSDTYIVMGNRPVASNESDETGRLNGLYRLKI
ncbi:MAG: hypothetical protein HC930_02285 [Hydrococcus sp. SU_1_0]|nr:hypothetical protein [Hydrococcus sp. SU_1_0]